MSPPPPPRPQVAAIEDEATAGDVVCSAEVLQLLGSDWDTKPLPGQVWKVLGPAQVLQHRRMGSAGQLVLPAQPPAAAHSARASVTSQHAGQAPRNSDMGFPSAGLFAAPRADGQGQAGAGGGSNRETPTGGDLASLQVRRCGAQQQAVRGAACRAAGLG